MPTCPFCSRFYPQPSSVCPHCLKTQPDTVGTTRRVAGAAGDAMHGRWRLLVLLLLLGGVASWGYDRYRRLPANAYSPDTPLALAPEPALAQVQTTIAPPIDVVVADSASARIEGGRWLAFPFSGVSRTGCHVTGSVRALSGGDRRVKVFIVDRDGLAELESGAQPRSWYDSGPVSSVAIDVKLDGRTAYTLVVANAGPRAKTVRLKNIRAACAD